MSDSEDEDNVAVVVGALAGIVLVTLGVLFAKSAPALHAKPKAVAQSPVVATPALAESDIAAVGAPLARILFPVGKAQLPADAGAGIDAAVLALAAKPGSIVLLSGFHDASGDPVRNAELARERAKAVRTGLIAMGVAEDRIKLRKPESALAGGSAEEARRVEIRVQ